LTWKGEGDSKTKKIISIVEVINQT
jgi:hypothetical protein